MSAAPRLTFILGGARSGKSRHAEHLAQASGLELVYLATGWAGDDEMAARIDRHRQERSQDWTTLEERTDIAGVIARQSRQGRLILIDCLTLWLSNLFAEERDIEAHSAALRQALTAAAGRLIIVSNEIGLGIVPDTPLARLFQDHQGRLNQAVAAIADEVIFIAAGLPLTLKSRSPSSR